MNTENLFDSIGCNYTCDSREFDGSMERTKFSYIAEANGYGTLKCCYSIPGGKSVERSISGKFPIYSFMLANEILFKKFYDRVMIERESAENRDVLFMDFAERGSGEEAHDGIAFDDNAERLNAQETIDANPELFKESSTSDFLIENLIYMLEGADVLYFSDTMENCWAWLEALLSSLPVRLANRISYSIGDTIQSVPIDHKFDLVFLDSSEKGLIAKIRSLEKKVAIGSNCFFPHSIIANPNKEYYLAIRDRSDDLVFFNDFIDKSSYGHLSTELSDIYDMFVYLFRTDPMAWEHNRLLIALNSYYKHFSDCEKSEHLAREVLDFFIFSYGEPSDEEFIRGYVECLDTENLRYFLGAIVRKKKKSTAYVLLFDVISDYFFSFSKCKCIPPDIRSLLLQFAGEINRTPNNIYLIDFISGLNDYSTSQLNSKLVGLHNDRFNYYAIRYFNKIDYLNPIIDSVLNTGNYECYAHFISSFFPSSDNSSLQKAFSKMFFDALLGRLDSSWSKLQLRKELSDLFAFMRQDGFYFSDDENFDKASRLETLKSGLFEALKEKYDFVLARFIIRKVACKDSFIKIFRRKYNEIRKILMSRG